MVLGAGRSGSSLVAGLLADAGLDPGGDLLPPSEGNPTGYFERAAVNRLNEEVLAPHLGGSRVAVPPRLSWLAALPSVSCVTADDGQRARMQALLPREPFVLKDPRLSYTLGAWRRVLPQDAVFVCVFRDPGRVAASVAADARRDPDYYMGHPGTPAAVWQAWRCIHRAVLDVHTRWGAWAFIDADALVDAGDTRALSRLVGRDVPRERIDPALRRSPATLEPPADVRCLHDELRRRAVRDRTERGSVLTVPGVRARRVRAEPVRPPGGVPGR